MVWHCQEGMYMVDGMQPIVAYAKKNPEALVTYLDKILNGFFGNVFITWHNEKIIYVNQNLADSVHTPRSELLGMPLSELRTRKLWLRSVSAELYAKKEPFTAYNVSKYGEELYTVVSPIFDDKGEIVMGAHYSVTKPMLQAFSEFLEQEKAELGKFRTIYEYISAQHGVGNAFVAESAAARFMLKSADHVAGTDTTILLVGESGTGKEVLAKYIWSKSRREGMPFIPVNCAAIPRELMESEFFGYERGAFTGAGKNGKQGLFEMAAGGTLFMDEIGDLPFDMQSKLLRVLETGEVMRVGGTRMIRTDVRMIAATNRDLQSMVREKTFREDLYYRLNVIPIHLPPLRERREDMEPLAKHFLDLFNRKHGHSCRLSSKQMEALENYAWPGNIRELRNVIERFVITSDVAIGIQESMMLPAQGAGSITGGTVPLHEAVEAFERQYIETVLGQCGGKVSKAAEQLGVHRSVLYRKLGRREES